MHRVPERNLYLVPATGAIEINGVRVNARDGAAIKMNIGSRSPRWKIPNWCWSTPLSATVFSSTGRRSPGKRSHRPTQGTSSHVESSCSLLFRLWSH